MDNNMTEKEYRKAYQGNWDIEIRKEEGLFAITCPRCGGTGWMMPITHHVSSEGICNLCWGTGVVSHSKRIKYLDDILKIGKNQET